MKNLKIGSIISRNEAKSIKGGMYNQSAETLLVFSDNDEQTCTAYCGPGKASVTCKGTTCHARDYDGCENSDGSICCK